MQEESLRANRDTNTKHTPKKKKKSCSFIKDETSSDFPPCNVSSPLVVLMEHLDIPSTKTYIAEMVSDIFFQIPKFLIIWCKTKTFLNLELCFFLIVKQTKQTLNITQIKLFTELREDYINQVQILFVQ